MAFELYLGFRPRVTFLGDSGSLSGFGTTQQLRLCDPSLRLFLRFTEPFSASLGPGRSSLRIGYSFIVIIDAVLKSAARTNLKRTAARFFGAGGFVQTGERTDRTGVMGNRFCHGLKKGEQPREKNYFTIFFKSTGLPGWSSK